MRAVAIITARGGSKRMPRKNIRPFLGKPIIYYSIEAALASGIFEEVMVSTDDEEIAYVARQAGASVPFLRAEKTSDDFATTADVLLEVLEMYRQRGHEFDYACCCYPTAPFITPGKLKTALELLSASDADGIAPVTQYSVPIWWALKMEGQKVGFHWPENALKRSQDLAPAYYDAGQFYLLRVPSFLETGVVFSANMLGMEVPELEMQDIDNDTDWNIAEIKYTRLVAQNLI